MTAFDYSSSGWPIRPELAAAHRSAWEAIRRPGAWWSGAERVAIAEEVRRASACPLCRERRAALSPFAVEGVHGGGPQSEHAGLLPDAAVDAVHRLVTDASRLVRSWVEKLEAAGVSDAHYVELLGVVVAVVSVDAFHRALGLALEPLPDPLPGAPSRVRPATARPGVGWVPMIPPGRVGPAEADLYPGGVAGNVIQAMSLVPDAVRLLHTLSAAQYVPMEAVIDPAWAEGRALDRRQIELVAGRVSALNECFY